MNALKRWLKAATKAEIRELASLAGTSKSYVNQLANGTRNASPDMAGHLSSAAGVIALTSKEALRRLPALSRGDLNIVCDRCQYFRRCRDGK